MQTSDETPEERRRRQKREACARWREANREKAREANARWYAENREKDLAAKAAKYATPKGRSKELERQAAKYATPEGKAYTRDYHNKRRAEDPAFKLAYNHRVRINKTLKAAGAGKSCGSLELLGCSPQEYHAYIEALFEPGMTWENRKDWHVDHIRPLASYDLTDPEQQSQAFHFSNTRPLWGADNMAKGSLHEGIRHTYRRSANATTLEDVGTEGLAGRLSDQAR